jgi:hypothetical protein
VNLFGIPVVAHPLVPLSMTVPNRKHRRRPWMSEQYHRRVQKKWNKRFGTHEENCAIFVSPGAAGLFGPDTYYMNPKGIAVLRNFGTVGGKTNG